MKFRTAILVILFCIFAENSHLIFQAIHGRGNHTDTYYFLVDFSMYSVKAVLCSCVVRMTKYLPIAVVFYTLTIYYCIDCLNMFLFGNYDGLPAMLFGMGVAIIISIAIHFMKMYKIVPRNNQNRMGF